MVTRVFPIVKVVLQPPSRLAGVEEDVAVALGLILQSSPGLLGIELVVILIFFLVGSVIVYEK